MHNSSDRNASCATSGVVPQRIASSMVQNFNLNDADRDDLGPQICGCAGRTAVAAIAVTQFPSKARKSDSCSTDKGFVADMLAWSSETLGT